MRLPPRKAAYRVWIHPKRDAAGSKAGWEGKHQIPDMKLLHLVFAVQGFNLSLVQLLSLSLHSSLCKWERKFCAIVFESIQFIYFFEFCSVLNFAVCLESQKRL